MAKKVVGCRLIPALVGPKSLLLELMSCEDISRWGLVAEVFSRSTVA
jgi:hypothetical protein